MSATTRLHNNIIGCSGAHCPITRCVGGIQMLHRRCIVGVWKMHRRCVECPWLPLVALATIDLVGDNVTCGYVPVLHHVVDYITIRNSVVMGISMG